MLSLVNRLETFWIQRDSIEIEFCDTVSKDVDWSDYWISGSEFRRLQKFYGLFSTDFFAPDCSFRMKPYFARFASGELEGVDALRVSWEGN